jgi:Polyketide cyclase / dehydrase and lipid transport
MNRVATLAAIVIGFLPAAAVHALSVQSLDASLDDGVYRISLVAQVDAPVEDVAAVLTDYAEYRRLDPRIRASAVLPADAEDGELVRTVVRACAGFFCRNVERVERVERAEGELLATVIPERSELKRGVTRTTWRAADEATRVTYEAEFVPDFWVPSVIGRRFAVRALKSSTLELFDNVERRARER